MPETNGKKFLRYGIAILSVIVAIGVRLLLDPFLHDRLPFITLFAAVTFMAWFGGRGPAVLTLLLGTTAVAYFVLEPRYSLAVQLPEYVFGLFFYAALGGGMIMLFEQLRVTRDRADVNAAEARRQYALLQSETQGRQRAESVADEERERLRITLTSIGDGVITTDVDGRVDFLNPVASQLTGWTQQEAQGRPLENVFHIVNEATHLPVDNPALRSLREGRIVGLANHTILVSKDGQERPINDSASPIRDLSGNLLGAVLVFRDVTEQYRAEQAVRTSEARKSAILQTALDCIITMDHEGRVVEFNPAAEQTFGYKAEHLIGQELCEFIIPPSLRSAHRKGMAHYLKTGEGPVLNKRLEVRAMRANGSEFPVELAITRIPTEGPPLFTAYLRDISERIAAEAKLKDQEKQTRLILESISDAFCTFDWDWRFRYVNRKAEELLGRSREILIGKNHWDEYPDTLGTDVEQNYRRALAENVPLTFEYFYAPHERWYDIHAYPSPEGLSVYFRDVSDRKQVEVALRQSEEKLRLLADTIPQLAWMARADGHIFWYNRRWYEYTGTTPEEMEGWGWQSVHDPRTLPKVLERWSASISSGKPFEMVFPLKGVDAKFRSFLTRVNPLLDEQGQVLYWFGTNTDVDEQHRAQEALAQSEERFRQLADAMPQIVWSADSNGNIDYMNRRWHEFTGLPSSLGNDGWSQVIHSSHIRFFNERWAVSLQTGQPFEIEVRLLDHRSKTYRWHLIRTVAVHEKTGNVSRWFGTSTDIHEQKWAEESSRYLAEASAALAGVVDYESTLQKVANLAVPYFADWSVVDVVTPEGTLRQLAVAHQDAEKIALVHRLTQEYPHDPESPTGALSVLRTGKPQMIAEISAEMLKQEARDQRHLALMQSLGLKSFMCVPLIASDSPLGVLTFATAESGRTYTVADLALAMDLAQRACVAIENTQLYEALRETDRRKDEFLATLAHELRNPLAPIRNSLQILKMPHVDAETIERSRDMMERQVHHLVRLVDDLLDVSRVMRGKIELRKEQVELASVVARAVETVQPLVDAQGHQLNVKLRTDSLLVDADPVRLTQVIGNLLTNAAKYTEPTGCIWLAAEREGDVVVLRVRDSGIGIAPHMLPRIFELFVQADHASTKAQGGLGIGLTLVKSLVEMHNGTVEACSDGLGNGSEFIVRLPIAGQPAPSNGSDNQEYSVEKGKIESRRLMVVDDNQDAAISLALLLKLQGHEVQVAHSGPAALDMAKKYLPEVVFLDIGMPVMDGYEVARRLRQEQGLENVVLAALTGWGQQEDRRRTTEAGFDHHLVKPLEPQALESLLGKLRRPL